MVHVTMYTPPFLTLRNRQYLYASERYSMHFTCVITGDARVGISMFTSISVDVERETERHWRAWA